jgi:hypothetical protein
MPNLNWHSPASSSANSPSLIPNIEFTATIPPSIDTDYISEQVHNTIFHKEEDRDIKWEFLKTSSGSALLGFFKSLLQLEAGWLLGAAKLEAFRCYDRTLLTYYVEWYEGFSEGYGGTSAQRIGNRIREGMPRVCRCSSRRVVRSTRAAASQRS